MVWFWSVTMLPGHDPSRPQPRENNAQGPSSGAWQPWCNSELDSGSSGHYPGETCLMKFESFALVPEQGWPGFARSSEVEELLLGSLLRVGSGGIWRYYNFTSDTSVWSADSSPDNSLCVGWDCPVSGQASKIQEMTVSLTDDHSEHFAQLSEVVRRLISDFGLCSSVCS